MQVITINVNMIYLLFAVSDQVVNSKCNYFSRNADVSYSHCFNTVQVLIQTICFNPCIYPGLIFACSEVFFWQLKVIINGMEIISGSWFGKEKKCLFKFLASLLESSCTRNG